jgi:tetratricopeptide (TPR) repeat protein
MELVNTGRGRAGTYALTIAGPLAVQVGDNNTQYNYYISQYVHQEGTAGPRAAGAGMVVGDVPLPPAAFQPRAGLLQELREAGSGGAVVRVVTGMRGAGKTHVAAAYARSRIDAGWRLVAWLSAGDASEVLTGLAKVADQLGIGEAGIPLEDTARLVRHHLEVNGGQCLVVFDDMTDQAGLRPFLPAAGQSQVVITTASQAPGLGPVVPVDVFTEAEAVTFLAGRTRRADDGGALAVARELGSLPLALAQAGAVIAAQQLPYEVYLERLRSLPLREYLTPGYGEPYPHGVAEAVLLSLDTVMAADEAGLCRGVLEVVSLLSAAGAPRLLLYAAGEAGLFAPPGAEGSPAGARSVDEALGLLAGGSLLAFSGNGSSVIAHRLVMRVARERCAQQGTLHDLGMRVCDLLAGVTETMGDPRSNREVARDAIGQVTAVREYLDGCLDGDDPELAKILLYLRNWVLTCLNDLGDSFAQAVELGESLVADCERVLGADHVDTLAARGNLANAYLDAGRVAEVVPILEGTLADFERLLGPDHPDTLTARGNLALAYRDAGRIVEAVLVQEQALADRERVLGADHVDTLAARGNLANAYLDAGQIAEAVPLLERALADFERVMGAGHSFTEDYRARLAFAYQRAGRVTEAIALYGRALAVFERLLGDDHPDTLAARADLALAYRDAGRSAEAVLLLEQALADSDRVLGADHPNTALSRCGLALAYQDAGRLAEAILHLERALVDFERVLGADHPHTLSSRSSLAGAYQESGRATEAIPLLERTLADRERLLGGDHPDTLASGNNLASAYQFAGRAAEGIPLLEPALADSERVLGADHPQTVTCRGNLALAYHYAGRLAEAIPLLERTLADRERLLGGDHPHTASSRGYLAYAYQDAGRAAEAISLLERALADFEHVLGADHPYTRSTRDNLNAITNRRTRRWYWLRRG